MQSLPVDHAPIVTTPYHASSHGRHHTPSLSQVEAHLGNEVRICAKDTHGEWIVEGTDLLVSVGRTPNTKGTRLGQVGVELHEHGCIKANDRLETTAYNVWAMGDCADSPQFTHVAYHDFRVVRDNLKGGNRSTKDRIVPFCMSTDPELARVAATRSKRSATKSSIASRKCRWRMCSAPSRSRNSAAL